jgi:hypothetical protein
MLMRRMLAAAISAPLQGGNARGWKRLHSGPTSGAAEACDEYQTFTRQSKGFHQPKG